MRLCSSSYRLQLLLAAAMLIWSLAGRWSVSAANSLDDNNGTVHIGYFMTGDPYRAAAVNLAVDRAHEEGLLNRYNFRYRRFSMITGFPFLLSFPYVFCTILT